MATCTWKDCTADATEPHLDRNGRPWAHLCAKHSAEFNRTLTGGAVGPCLRAWVLAQGGAISAAERL